MSKDIPDENLSSMPGRQPFILLILPSSRNYMQYAYYPSHPDLADCVRTILILEGGEKQQKAKVPLYTNGMPGLILRTGQKSPGVESNILQLTLYGKSTPVDTWQAAEGHTVIAFFFRPFTMAAFFNVAAADLAKSPLELETWHAQKTNALKIQLCAADTPSKKIDALNTLLLHQWSEQQSAIRLILTATDRIMQDPGKEILPGLLKELGMHERTFQRLFKKYVGITASQYRRICQFQSSFTHLKEGNFDSLTDVAFTQGFADQSHFIRSFKDFLDLTPGEYIKSGIPPKK